MVVVDLTRPWGAYADGVRSGVYVTRTNPAGEKYAFVVPYYTVAGGGVLAFAAAYALVRVLRSGRRIADLGVASDAPTLYYLSVAGCPACSLAAPVVTGFERAARGRVRVVRLDAGDPRLPAMTVPALAVRTLAGSWALAQGLGGWLADPAALARWVAGAEA